VRRLRWWREVIYVLSFYGVYTLVRNRGLDIDTHVQAFHNAQRVIRAEEFLHSFHEKAIQDLFYPSAKWFLQFWNVFYGSAHFIVTIVAIVWLFRRDPARYPLWRNTLAFTTGLALIGFAFFPLMPPRLLDVAPPLGGGQHYGFVDTLAKVGGLWSFDSGTMQKISNQYAAMPSLHFGWSTWCMCVLFPLVRRRWLRALVLIYPFLTLFAIVVTANHFWLDAAGGAAVLAAGFVLARWFTAYTGRRLLPTDHADVDGLLNSFEPAAAGTAKVEGAARAGDRLVDGRSHVGGGQDLSAPR
jgi:hypothetical protein